MDDEQRLHNLLHQPTTDDLRLQRIADATEESAMAGADSSGFARHKRRAAFTVITLEIEHQPCAE